MSLEDAPRQMNMGMPRCSLIDVAGSTETPRAGLDDSVCFTARDGDADGAGFTTNRSSTNSIQLTGIKPKALVFESPMKSPEQKQQMPFSTTSTKDQTASAGARGIGSGFGGIKLMHCPSGSPPVVDFDQQNDGALREARPVTKFEM